MHHVFLPLGLPHVGDLLHDVNFLDTRVLAAELLDLVALVDVPAVGRALGYAGIVNSGCLLYITAVDNGGERRVQQRLGQAPSWQWGP